MSGVPSNLWQSNSSNNGREEPVDVVSKTPTVAYQPPIPFDTNQDFQFNTSERCERIFGSSAWNTTGVTFETPAAYNSTFANITFQVRNATGENRTIIDVTGTTESGLEQAQGFNLTEDAFMQGFSIYVSGATHTSEASVTMSIRDGSPGGPVLRSIPVILPYGVNQWCYFPLSSPLALTAGQHYYVYTPKIVVAARSRWMNTSLGATTADCYALIGGVWQPQLWNLTLKIDIKSAINPESVFMNVSNQVSNQSILNLGSGTGWANLTAPITGSSINFPVYNTSNIEYSYAGNLTFFRNATTTNAVTLTNGNANWTLTAFSYPGSSYSVYQGNITGFNANHTSVQGFLGSNTVGFTRPPPYDTLIFSSAVDRITFQSTNYITFAEVPTEVHSNQDVDLNITVGDVGTVNITIYNGTESIYENGSFDLSGPISYHWHVDTSLPAGEYTFEATFFMLNQVGFFRQNFTISKVATINTYTLNAKVLDLLRLNFRLYDLYADVNLAGATVNYNFANLTGSLDYAATENYTKDIDLGIFSIPPGPYTLSLTAQKTGYQTVFASMPVTIAPRPIDIKVTDLASSVVIGGFVEVNVVALDLLTGDDLLRPVDFNITIYRSGGNPDVDSIASAILKSVITTDTEILPIPTTAALGAYDILIRVSSDYYTGSYVITNGVRVEEPWNIWISVLIVAGVAVVAAAAYVQRQRALSKRSVRGAIVMNPGGMPIARRIAADFSTMNPHLIAGAVMGIVTMVKEMTGSSIRTIALEGRYLKIVLRDAFWFVLLTKRNPSWISGTVKKVVADIEQRYGAEIAAWKGEGNIHISLDLTLQRWFGVDLKESRDPELEMSGSGNPENQEKGDPNPPAPPAPPVNP